MNTVAPPLAGNVLGPASGNFVIAEWKDAGSPTGEERWIALFHLHHNDDEAWYVLEGKLQVRVGTEIVNAAAGSAVLVARGTPHTYRNAGSGSVRYLLIMTPKIYALIQAIHSLRDRSFPALQTVFEKYDSELIG
jgi:oxalate decarboxylase/phosphoglucose isomerase-like protein (cupin superfamily)